MKEKKIELKRTKALNRQKDTGCSCPTEAKQTCKLNPRISGQRGNNVGGNGLG